MSQGPSPAAGVRAATPHRLRPPECVANSDRPVSRSARASACRQSNLRAARFRSRPRIHDPIEKPLDPGRLLRSRWLRITPIPGMLSSRWLASFPRCCALIRFSIDPISLSIARSAAASTTRLVCASIGNRASCSFAMILSNSLIPSRSLRSHNASARLNAHARR